MEGLRRKIQVAAVIFIALLLSSCFDISIVRGVKDPHRYFKRAYSRIEEIHRHYPKREKRAHRLQLLIYENSEGNVVQMSLPLWFVRGCLDMGMKMAEGRNHFDFDEKYDFDWKAIRDLGRLGRGLLVEVEDEDNKVLIWLE